VKRFIAPYPTNEANLMQNDTAVITGTELIPTAISTDTDSDTEKTLTDAITELWSVHVQAQSIVRKTKGELKAVRHNLAEHLFTMKLLLARPGRGGQWSSFLSQHNIPRTSADRLVSAHERFLSVDGNRTAGATKELSDEEIAQVAKTTWARLRNKLGTHQALYQFFSRLIVESGIPYDTFDDGILILLDPVQAPEAPAAATAPAGGGQ
jgi:hypothetical protein